MNGRIGTISFTIAGGEMVAANVPPPLPPVPALDVLQLLPSLVRAERAVGRLDGVAVLLPAEELFLYMYVRKEAVLSSQIEGTQSTLTDLLRFEAEAQTGQPLDDVREVSNYVDAMLYGLDRMCDLPLSLRLIREMHARLMNGVRGGHADPGEFRRTQNWIGGTRPGNAAYVPPPAAELPAVLSALEQFLHETDSGLPHLLKAGLIHVQFETIHPFLDGNGRIGRLLVTLYLCAEGVMRRPLLYLSLFLKTHRARYYDLLQAVRTEGDWEAWLIFFLDGVAATANGAFEAAKQITQLFEADRMKLTASSERPGSTLRIHEQLKRQPFATATKLAEVTGLTPPTINAALVDLVRLGIVSEVTGRRRGRVFAYSAYLAILNEGTAPLS